MPKNLKVFVVGQDGIGREGIIQTIWEQSKVVKFKTGKNSKCGTIKIQNKNYNLELYDIGSDDSMMTILGQPSVIIFVYYEANKTTFDIFNQYWYDIIKEKYSKSVIALVGIYSYENFRKKVSQKDLDEIIEKSGALTYKVNTDDISELDKILVETLTKSLEVDDGDESKDEGKNCCCLIY